MKYNRSIYRFFVQMRLTHLISFIMVFIMVFLAVFANFIMPHSPYDVSLPNKFIPPFWCKGGNLSYLLGTDVLGRDILSRTIMGVRVSLFIAFLSLLAGGAIGGIIGIIAGYFGGIIDNILMRVTVVTIAFPIILLAMYLVVILGPSITILIIVLALTLWARIAWVIRGEAKTLTEKPYIAQALIVGCSPVRVMITHIFPNLLNTLIVLLTLNVGWVIIVAASLSFLGAGVPPPIPSLGSMVNEGKEFISKAWWVSVVPGSAILVIVLAFNLIGDWLRDITDPHLMQI